MHANSLRTALLVIWSVGLGITSLILLTQTAFKRYGSDPQDAWSWLLPSILPVMGFMVAIFMDGSTENLTIKRSRALFAVGFSVFYMFLLTATLLLLPFWDGAAMDWLKMSNYWLAPIQAIADGTLISVFIKR